MVTLTSLSVTNHLSWVRLQEPVSSGLPVPREHQLSDISRLHLYNDKGEPVSAQFMPLAWWDDTVTIKWVLVQFQADVGANGESKYVVRMESENKVTWESGRRMIALWHGEAVKLDTGILKGTIGRSAGAFITDLSISVNGDWRPVFQEETTEMGPQLVSVSGESIMMGKPHEILIEDNGAERAVVKVSGDYLVEEGLRKLTDFSYEIRIFAYRGRRELRITHSLISRTKEATLHELAFHIPAIHARYIAGNDAGEVMEFPPVTPGFVSGIMQDSEEEYLLGDLCSSSSSSKCHGQHLWWMAAEMEHATVFAAVKYFFQRYPKSLEGHQDRFKIGLLPGLSANKDSYPPANQLKSHYEFMEGEVRTHELLLCFDPTPTDPVGYEKLTAAFHSPMLALAPWDWYTGSGVLGDLMIRSDKYPVYENAVDESLDIYLKRRGPLHLYGDRNFGDDGYLRDGFWNNCEYDYAHTGMMHFLRGAGRSWYDNFTLPAVTHLMDIDICHSGAARGKIYPHCDWHNSGEAKLGSHSWIRGILEYYCFSGDFRAKDAATMIADVWSDSIMKKVGGEGTERGVAWPCISMLAMYQTFPEKRYLDAASLLIHKFLETQDPVEGDFKGTFSRLNTKDHWSTFLIGSPVLEALTLYVQTTGDERFKEVVVKVARRLARINWLEDIGAWEYTISTVPEGTRAHNAKTDKMVTPGVLYAYLYSGEEELLEKAISAFKYSESIPAVDGKDLAQSYCFGARIPALLERALQEKNKRI